MGTAKGWMVQVGGNGGAKARLARELARNVSTEEALAIINKVIKFFKDKGQKKHRRLGALIEEMGFEEFKKAILGETLPESD